MSSVKMKKAKKCAVLDKQYTDAEKRQRGRRREQDNKAGKRPTLQLPLLYLWQRRWEVPLPIF